MFFLVFFTSSQLNLPKRGSLQLINVKNKLSKSEVQNDTRSELTADLIFDLKQQMFEFSERQPNFDEKHRCVRVVTTYKERRRNLQSASI